MKPIDHDTSPWYQQFWPWALIALPLSAVIASLITIRIAVQDPDGLVVDDYYRAGLAINRDLARDRAAFDQGISGELTLTHDLLELVLTSHTTRLPDQVELKLLHATRAGQDQLILLADHGDGRFTSPLPPLSPGRWNLDVSGADWRLKGSLEVPRQTQAALRPAQK